MVCASYEEEMTYPNRHRGGHRRSSNDSNDVLDHELDPVTEKKARIKRGLIARKTKDGELQILKPKELSWWLLYVNNTIIEEEEHCQNKFRQ